MDALCRRCASCFPGLVLAFGRQLLAEWSQLQRPVLQTLSCPMWTVCSKQLISIYLPFTLVLTDFAVLHPRFLSFDLKKKPLDKQRHNLSNQENKSKLSVQFDSFIAFQLQPLPWVVCWETKTKPLRPRRLVLKGSASDEQSDTRGNVQGESYHKGESRLRCQAGAAALCRVSEEAPNCVCLYISHLAFLLRDDL